MRCSRCVFKQPVVTSIADYMLKRMAQKKLDGAVGKKDDHDSMHRSVKRRAKLFKKALQCVWLQGRLKMQVH